MTTAPTSHLGKAAIVSSKQSAFRSHRQANARQPHSVCYQNNRNGGSGGGGSQTHKSSTTVLNEFKHQKQGQRMNILRAQHFLPPCVWNGDPTVDGARAWRQLACYMVHDCRTHGISYTEPLEESTALGAVL